MKNSIVLGILILLTACQDIERPVAPENLIAEDKMVDVFTDIYLASAARSVNFRVIRSNGIMLDSLIYEKHGIDSLQFARSNEFYSSDLPTYNGIFEKVEERLIRMKGESDSIKNAPKKNIPDQFKKDSVNKKDSVKKPSLADPVTSEMIQDSIE